MIKEVILGFLISSRFGLSLNIVGTIMVAFSFGKNLEDAYQEDKKGRKVYLASFRYPMLFYLGLVIMILGFIQQLIAG